ERLVAGPLNLLPLHGPAADDRAELRPARQRRTRPLVADPEFHVLRLRVRADDLEPVEWVTGPGGLQLSGCHDSGVAASGAGLQPDPDGPGPRDDDPAEVQQFALGQPGRNLLVRLQPEPGSP